MKRIILSILIGLTATTGAMADDGTKEQQYASFLECVEAFHNDSTNLNQLNEGDQTAQDAQFTGIKDIVKLYDTPEEQYNAITNVDQNSDKYDYEAYRNYVVASLAMLQFWVASKCPQYFIHFIDYYSTDGTKKMPEELAGYIIAEDVGGKQQIKLVSAEDYNNSQSSFKKRQALTFNPNMAGEFYMLLLPTDLSKKSGQWLTYKDGMEALKDYKNQSCGDGWYVSTRLNTGAQQKENYFVDVIDHVNIHKSFPGLLVPMNTTVNDEEVSKDSIAVRAQNNSAEGGALNYIGMNNFNDNVSSAGAVAYASEKSKILTKKLQNSNCANADKFSVYIASPQHPLYLVDSYIGEVFNKITKTDRTAERNAQQFKKNILTYGGYGVAGAGVLGLSALGLKAWATSTPFKSVIGASAGKAVAGSSLAVGGIVLGLIGVFKTVGDAFSEMEESLPVSGYDKMYIYYKAPLSTYAPKISAKNELKQVLDKQEAQTTSNASSGLALPGGNAGTPAKSGDKKVITNEFVF